MNRIIILFFFLSVTFALSISDTKISTSRNPTRTSICSYYNTTFNDAERKKMQPLIKNYNYLKNEEIEKIVYKKDFSQPGTTTYLIMMPHIICGAIMILIFPALALCTIRPEKYPACKSFRKPQNEMYQKFELKWPVAVTCLCYLVIIGGSAAALAGGTNIISHYSHIGCRLTALADDTLNGRLSTTDNSSFFVGIAPLSSQLADFQTKYNTFYSQSLNSLDTAQNVRNKQTIIQNNIQSEYISYTNPTYNNAFKDANGSSFISVTSQFKEMFYGPVNDSSKILGNIQSQLSKIFTEVNTALDPMIAAWQILKTAGQASTQTEINSTISSISSNQVQLNAIINFYNTYDNQNQFNALTTGMQFIYGIVLALALLGILSTCILGCCVVVRIRLIMYFTCTFLIVVGIVTFIMLILMAGLLPTIAQSCKYIDTKLSTSDGMMELLQKLQFNTSASLYANCSKKTGNGDMVYPINPQFTQTFQSIRLIANYTQQFATMIPSFSNSNLQNPFTQATTTLNTLQVGTKLQFTNTQAKDFIKNVIGFKSIALPPPSCTHLLSDDFWVVSTQVINCQASFETRPLCGDLSSSTTCPQGCYKMYQQFTTTSVGDTNYATTLRSRYGASCNYADHIIDLFQNWIMPKEADLTSVQTNLSNIQGNTSTYELTVGPIVSSLSSFNTILQQNFNSQMNLTSGSFYGVDCRVIGQAINQLRDSVCVGFLSSIQYNFIVLCLISYGILLLSCFTVCAGVRHFQHLQKMQIKGYKGVPISITQNRIDQKSYA